MSSNPAEISYTFFPLPVTAIDPKLSPQVSTIQLQSDGSLLIGLLFAKPALLKIKIEQGKITEALDQEVEKAFDQDFLGITGGLRGTRTGDTAFATLHRGGGGLMGMFKKTVKPENPEAVWSDLATDKNSFGFSYKHSLVQIHKGQFVIRILKNSGALLDAAHIGDFIFGLTGGAVFRQPYLNPEKTYVLRDDLEPNYRLHKVEDGVFWLLGREHRLMKANLTDSKALPTTKKLPGSPFRDSVDMNVDGWLYGIADQTLFRLRVNKENRLDELQPIKVFEGALPVSVAGTEDKVDDEAPRRGRVWISTQNENKAELFVLTAEAHPDSEALAPPPSVTQVLSTNDLAQLGNLLLLDQANLVGSCEKKAGELGLFQAKV